MGISQYRVRALRINIGVRKADCPLTEVGAEWVNDYPWWLASDLSHMDDSATGLIYELDYWSNWIQNFCLGNGYAWEEDFKMISRGGMDNYYVDNVDLAMFCGHGTDGYLLFGNGAHDDRYLDYFDAEWGDKDLEWIFLQACSTLEEDDADSSPWKSDGKFAQALDGVHLICGSATVMHDIDVGSSVGTYLAFGMWYTAMESWFYGCDDAGEHSGIELSNCLG